MELRNPGDAVRKRPGMFVGDTWDGSGIVNMVLDLVANAYDQVLVGRCSRIRVDIGADGTICVSDDGPGIPVNGDGRLPPLEKLLTTYCALPTVDGHRPHVHLGLGALGLFVVNALSERFEVVTVREGIEARAVYSRGEVIEPLAVIATGRASGTKIRFRPDP